MKTATMTAPPDVPESLPVKPAATPEQVRLWLAWAAAVRACEAARSALLAYADLTGSDPDAPPCKSYELTPDERYEGAMHAAYALRMSLGDAVGRDTPEEVEYLLGRLDGGGDRLTRQCNAMVRERVERRFGALLPARESA
jgi:hypothetical protein